MCEFCKYGYRNDSDIFPDGNFIRYSPNTNKFEIVAGSGDPYCDGLLEDVKFCPYCGEKLVITERKTVYMDDDFVMGTDGKPSLISKGD